MAGEARRKKLRALLKRAEVKGVEAEALDAAFTHESAVPEGLAAASNERLEFLGDAVLGFVVARWLFAQYPQASEGELALRKSSLVSDTSLLAEAAGAFGDSIKCCCSARGWPSSGPRLASFHRSPGCVRARSSAALQQCGGGRSGGTLYRQRASRTHARNAGSGGREDDVAGVDAKAFRHDPALYQRAPKGPRTSACFHSRVVVSGGIGGRRQGDRVKKPRSRTPAQAAIALLREEYGLDLDPEKRAGA